MRDHMDPVFGRELERVFAEPDLLAHRGGSGPAGRRPDPPRRTVLVTVVVGVVVVIAAALAITTARPRTGPAVLPSPTASSSGRAVDLLPVVWHVHDAAGAGSGTYLLFRDGQAEVLEPQGYVLLSWAAQGDALLTLVEGWSESLGTKRAPTVPWLTDATRFRRSGSGWILLGPHGERLATLRDDGPAPRSSTTVTTPEPITADTRARLADADGGAGIRTVPLASVLGRWSVRGLDPAHASLTLAADGTWRTAGGCESGTGQDLGGAGRFRLLSGGFVLLVETGSAGVGCAEPARKPPADAAALTAFWSARSLLVRDDRLTLFDARGHRIGTLDRVD